MTRAAIRSMQDPRWSQLKQILVAQGWVWRDDTLHAPHDTMWFTTSSDDPDVAMFRDRVCAGVNIDQAAVQADLVSLVAALDAVLAN